jgi:Transposase
LGVSEATFYVWKKKYANLGSTEIRELRQLREENAKLKRLVADLSLDTHILTEIVREKAFGLMHRRGPVNRIRELRPDGQMMVDDDARVDTPAPAPADARLELEDGDPAQLFARSPRLNFEETCVLI